MSDVLVGQLAPGQQVKVVVGESRRQSISAINTTRSVVSNEPSSMSIPSGIPSVNGLKRSSSNISVSTDKMKKIRLVERNISEVNINLLNRKIGDDNVSNETNSLKKNSSTDHIGDNVCNISNNNLQLKSHTENIIKNNGNASSNINNVSNERLTPVVNHRNNSLLNLLLPGELVILESSDSEDEDASQLAEKETISVSNQTKIDNNLKKKDGLPLLANTCNTNCTTATNTDLEIMRVPSDDVDNTETDEDKIAHNEDNQIDPNDDDDDDYEDDDDDDDEIILSDNNSEKSLDISDYSDLPDEVDEDELNQLLCGTKTLTRRTFPIILKLFERKTLTFEQFDSFCTQKVCEYLTERCALGKEREEIRRIMKREQFWRQKYMQLNKEIDEAKSVVRLHKEDLKENINARPHVVTRTVGLQAVLCPRTNFMKLSNTLLPRKQQPAKKPVHIDDDEITIVDDVDSIETININQPSTSKGIVHTTVQKKLPSLTPVAMIPSSPDANSSSPPVANSSSPPASNSPSLPVTKIPSSPVEKIPSSPVEKIPSSPVTKIPSSPVEKIPSSPVAKIPSSPVAKIPSSPVAKIPSSPVAKIPSSPVAKIPSSPVAKIPSPPVAKITPLPVPVVKPATITVPLQILNTAESNTIDLTDDASDVNNESNTTNIELLLEKSSAKIVQPSVIQTGLLSGPSKSQPANNFSTQTVQKGGLFIEIPTTSSLLVRNSTAGAATGLTVNTSNLNTTGKTPVGRPFMYKDGKLLPIHIAPLRNPGPIQTGNLQPVNIYTARQVSPQLLQPVPAAIPIAKHPAPLPNIPNQRSLTSWKKLPPPPKLNCTSGPEGPNPKAIVLSWTLNLNKSMANITSYQIFAYHESSTEVPSTSLWNKIGDVNALPLPMACSLTQFVPGEKYHFAVRAVDVYSRVGPFSLPHCMFLPPS